MGKRKAEARSAEAPLRRSARATAVAGPRFSYRYTSDEEAEVPKSYAATSRKEKGKSKLDSDSEAEEQEEPVKKERESDDEESGESEGTEPEDEEQDFPSPSSIAEDDDDENSSTDTIEHNDLCEECGRAGELICCDFCSKVYHIECLDPPLSSVPHGDWGCPYCQKAKNRTKPKRKKPIKESDKPIRPKRRRIQKQRFDEDDDYDDEGELKASKEAANDGEFDSGVCDVCGDVGFLIVCEGCDKPYHLKCHDPPLDVVPEGEWFCTACVEESEGTVDRIICWRFESVEDPKEAPQPGTPEAAEKIRTGKQYFVKWNNRSYIHCEWVGEQRLQKMADQKLRNFKKSSPPERRSTFHNKRDGDLYNPEWHQIDRIIDEGKEGGRVKYLVKWTNLSYGEATWEFADDPLMAGKSLEAYVEKYQTFNDFDLACEEVQRRVEKQRQIDMDKASHFIRSRSSLRSRRRQQGSQDDEDMGTPGSDRMDTDSNADTDAEGSSAEEGKQGSSEDKEETPGFQKMDKQPELLRGHLHDYQLEGVNWLIFSWYRHTNVILADEMGLGKTIQTIAFFVALHELFSVRGPYLLVVPLSTITMWEREFSIWAPHLNAIMYKGKQPARKIIRDNEFYYKNDKSKRKVDKLIKFNVLVTSYEMILADTEYLRNLPWEGIAIDEAHRLKNNNSKLFQVLRTFKSQHCLLLTGTPLQNNLGELFHLLNFLVREKFSSLEEFEKELGDIGKSEQITKLHAMLAPHMLRRLKSDVMKEIPPKSEVIVPVDLSALQKEYYRAILTRNYEVLRKNNKNSSSLLNVVMELKKCANHPYLFDNAEPPTKTKREAMRLLVNASGKMMLLDRMLSKLKEQGHRVLVFSQMTRLLDILEDYVLDCGYKYERIDGNVVGDDRQARIDRFNAPNSDRFLFLLSTRAGGLGINLATADTVIIYDADWNPHNDMQALSRAHRIGQTSKVMVFRLVTRASIEERIIQISKSKMMLDHIVVKKMGKGGETLFAAGELDDILRFGTEEIFSSEDKPAEGKDGKEGEKDGEKQGESAEDEAAWAKYGGMPSSKGIYYDDAAVEKLLDRTRDEEGENVSPLDGSKVQNEYLNSFKVASYSVDKEGKNDSSYWERLLREAHLREQEELHARIKDGTEGRRQRRLISYAEDQPFFTSDDEEWEFEEDAIVESEDEDVPDAVLEAPNALSNAPVKKRTTRGDKGEKVEKVKRPRTKKTSPPMGNPMPQIIPQRSAMHVTHVAPTPIANMAHVGSIPLMGGAGRSILVLGFNQSQRQSFHKLLLWFGVGDGTWSHFTPHLQHTLLNKSTPEIAAYGANLLSHLLEQPNNSDKFADGVPKENLNVRETLLRLATIHLIRQKVIECITPAGANLPPKEFDIEEANCTDLHASWEILRFWKKEHDKALLFGVMKHGYGRFPHLTADVDLGLVPPILEQQKDKIPHPSLTGTQNGQDHSANAVIFSFLRKRLLLLEQALNIEHHIRVTRSLMQAQGHAVPPSNLPSAAPATSSAVVTSSAYPSAKPNPQPQSSSQQQQRTQTFTTSPPVRPATTHVQINPPHTAPTNKPFSSVSNTGKFNIPSHAAPPLTPVAVSQPRPSVQVYNTANPAFNAAVNYNPQAQPQSQPQPHPHPHPAPAHAPPHPIGHASTLSPSYAANSAGYHQQTPIPQQAANYAPAVSAPVPTPAAVPPAIPAPNSPKHYPALTPVSVPTTVPSAQPISTPTPISTPIVPSPVLTPSPTSPSTPTPTPTPTAAQQAPANPRIAFITKFKELYSAVHNIKEQMLTFLPGVNSDSIRNDLHAIGALALETELKLREVPPS